METTDKLKFDNEYSRLIGAIGKETLEKLQANSVLIVGCKGLGLEIAKNIVLMGVKKLTIHDNNPVQIRDLSSNFFLSEQDVGKPRAAAMRAKLQELNERCELSVLETPVTEEVVTKYRIVVLTDNTSREQLVKLAEAGHRAGVAVIATDCWGVFGYVFVDMGVHTITDRTGERPKSGYLASFSRHNKSGICVCIDRHDLEDGMTVTLTEIHGIPGINGKQFKITTVDPFAFSIDDVSAFEGDYLKGGLFEEVKQPFEVTFESLGTQLGKPLNVFDNFVPTDYAKMFDAPQQMLLTLALLEFRAAHDGALPRNHDAHDAQEVLDMARALNAQTKHVEDQIDEVLIKQLAGVSRGDLNAMAATFGGIIAQEVIKASSGKYMPIKQWSFFDARELLPKHEEGTDLAKEYAEQGTRYDGQVAVLGRTLQNKLEATKYFLVGAGAIGCEMLKNWACMGIGSGPNGQVFVTDNDIIEISNLNRQFLYRSWDEKCPKSETSAKAAKKINPSMNIKAYTTKVCTETEDVFNDDFWGNIDGVCNALDNIHARLYVDSKCVFYSKSLLESGTLGTKGNTQVMVPHVSQTYGETTDPEPKEVAKCLLHSFPSNIEHCLQWGRELLFEGEFVSSPEEVNLYLKNPSYINSLTELDKKKKLDILDNLLIKRQKTMDECVAWARLLFEDYYVWRPKQLIHTFPMDSKDNVGQPFWQGTRRPPKPTPFDSHNESHIDFIVAASFLRAYILGVTESEFKPKDLQEQRQHIAKVAAQIQVPVWQPKNVKIAYDPAKEKEEKESEGISAEDDANMKRVLGSLPQPSDLGQWKARALDFEKDDDSNFHIDFVFAASNLRAVAYDIPTVSRLQAKLIAGKIIPAIVTTTAVVAGLVCIELFKLLQGKNAVGDYRNSFCNLAIPLFQITEVVPPASFIRAGKKYTTWDSLKVKEGDITLQQFLDVMQAKHGVKVSMVSYVIKNGVKLLYMDFGDYSENLQKKVSTLVQELLQQEKLSFEPKQRCFQLLVAPEDDSDVMDVGPENGEDETNLPPVWFYFK